VSVRRHRPSRLPFIAAVQVMAVDTGEHMAAQTDDLTLSGCFVETPSPLLEGEKVAVQISYNGMAAMALGEIAFSDSGRGMGIRFTSIEPSSASILDAWLTELGN
jgi:PilZ domain